MRLKALLASTALAAATLTLPAITSLPFGSPAAQAAASVSISVFYDELGGYGDWVDYDNRTVFVPASVGREWRPYTVGHWEYTDRYGWTWVSEEPFGWATYHYGRWGHADDIGWYWVPGTRWAPAWVSWRRSSDHVVWAPLPPDTVDEVDIRVSDESIPDVAWVAVPTRQFLVPNISVAVVSYEEPEYRTIVREARPIGTVRVRNDVVVNNVIEVNQIEQATGERVKRVKLRSVDDPRQAAQERGGVGAYTGKIEKDPNAKPREITDLNTVKQRRSEGASQQNTGTTKATGEGTTSTQSGGQTTGTQTEQGGQATTTTKPGQTTTGTATEDSSQTGDQTGKNKKKTGQSTTETTTDQPATGSPATEQSGQSVTKKNTGQTTEDSGQSGGTKKKDATGTATEGSGQGTTAKAKKSTGETATGETQDTTKTKTKKKQVEEQAGSKKQKAGQSNAGQTEQGGQSAPQANEQPSGQKKKKNDAAAAGKAQGAANPGKAGKSQGEPQTTGSTSKAGNEASGNGNAGKKKVIEQQGGNAAGNAGDGQGTPPTP